MHVIRYEDCPHKIKWKRLKKWFNITPGSSCHDHYSCLPPFVQRGLGKKIRVTHFALWDRPDHHIQQYSGDQMKPQDWNCDRYVLVLIDVL